MSTVVDLGAFDARVSVIDGKAAGDRAGFSVSSAGDFNGDGFDDIIIGAPFSDNRPANSGSAYVIFGGAGGFGAIDLANLQLADGFRIDGERFNDHAGLSVSAAGDVNGDGFDDVIVDAARQGLLGYGVGVKAYVIFGKASGSPNIDLASLTASTGFAINGPFANENGTVSDAGDINGDGFDDIILGVGSDNKAYVIFGKASGFGTIDVGSLGGNGFAIQGGTELFDIAADVSAAGDVNGDGFDDIIVSANTSGFYHYGSDPWAYVVFGKESGFGTVDLSNLPASDGFAVHGEYVYGGSKFSVSGAGDVNGDGFDDIILGHPAVGAGAAYVIFGKASGFGTIELTSLAPTDGFIVQGDQIGDDAGWSVSAAGDVNSDGLADIIIGAPVNDNVRSGPPFVVDAGETYVIFGKTTGFGTIDVTNLAPSDGFVIQGGASLDRAGFSVSAAGDTNGDGFDDLVIGAPNSDRGGVEAGAVYIISGRRDFPADTSGDFNGDGRDDVILRHSNGWMTEWLGQANGSFFDNGALASNWFHPNWQVVGTGDFNGDTRDDLLLRNVDGTFVERLGQANGSFASNNAANDWAHPSWHVEATNDFNGDGHDDLLFRHNDGWLVKWFGQADGSFSDNGVGGNWIGPAWQVAATGDFNGDGEDDILLRHNDSSIVEWLGQENGNFLVNNAAKTSLNAAWDIVIVGDFNGDTRDDLLLRHDDGTVAEWLGQINGSFLANNAATTWVHPNWLMQPTNDVLL